MMATARAVLAIVFVLLGAACGEEDAGSRSAGASVPAVTPGVAGYNPVSDVSSHAKIDLDIKEIMDAVGKADWGKAAKIYVEGKNSVKSSGEKRTLQGFSKSYAAEGTAKQDEPMAKLVNAFWGRFDYADKVVSAALGNCANALPEDNCPGIDDQAPEGFPSLGNFGTGALAKGDDVRSQLIKKGVAYASTWMYALHEMEVALVKYKAGEYDVANGAPYYLDEAWVFYAGSEESGNADGSGPYTGGEKFGKLFGTYGYEMGTGGRSYANKELLYQFTAMQRLLQTAGNDEALEDIAKCIRSQFMVPLIQGCLSYTFKASSEDLVPQDSVAKYKAEAWAFCITALPFLHNVDPESAKAVLDTATINAVERPDWQVVKTAFSGSNLNKMGILCDDVGFLGGGGVNAMEFNKITGEPPLAYAAAELKPCTDDLSLVANNAYSNAKMCETTRMPRCGGGVVCSAAVHSHSSFAVLFGFIVAAMSSLWGQAH